MTSLAKPAIICAIGLGGGAVAYTIYEIGRAGSASIIALCTVAVMIAATWFVPN